MNTRRGTDLPHARLTPEAVRAIRTNRRGWKHKQWADHLGVSVSAVSLAKSRATWAWVR